MKALPMNVLLLVALSLAGCGSGGKGPAKPEETPVMTQEQVNEAMTRGMPPDAKKRYDQMKKEKGMGS